MEFTDMSFRGRRWQMRPASARAIDALMHGAGLPEPLARLLAVRGIAPEAAEGFLKPSIRSALPDPSGLKDMDKAVARLCEAIIAREKIVIFGDYDVDGATSVALLVRFIRMCGHDAGIYIPDRILEGYGPNTEALLNLKNEGAGLVVTVDCGTVSFEPLLAAKEAGLDTIVVDHHLAVEALPDAIAIINPNRLDDTFPEKGLCAAGVCFLLAVAVNRELRTRGFFADKPEPDLMSLLDLAALGTVCDVMPLTGLNRAYVAQGLKILAQKRNLGLATLMDVARVAEAPSAYTLGFLLGPRINAGGRIGQADLGARLLTTENPLEALRIAEQLDKLNGERRALEALMLEEATAMAESQTNAPMILVAKEGWHPGVIGIVAGRLKEKYNRPAAVVALDKGIGKASARSITGVDLGGAVTQARMDGLLVAGGGHAMAAGFTVEEPKLPQLTDYLWQKLEAAVAKATEERILHLDAAIGVAGANVELAQHFMGAGPYGPGHPEPMLVLPGVRLTETKIVGQGHMSGRVTASGIGSGGWLKAIAFRVEESGLAEALAGGGPVHLAGKLKSSHWQGRDYAEFHIEDVMKAS